MKRKFVVVIPAMLLLILLMQSALADNSKLCFSATNDRLLDLNYSAVSINGTYYVPATIFTTFGVNYNDFDSKSSAILFTSTKQVFFDLTNGNSYDSNMNYYSASATYKNGQIYVPVAWVCTYFGLSYSPISGNEYGDIIRIKDGKEYLTDSQFLDAASSLMRSYYNAYYGTNQSPSPSSSPSPSPSDGSNIETKSASISIGFIGLPSEKLLNSLDNYAARVCFFVTADEAVESPDIIRRICGSGHSIGIYCTASPDTDCQNTADLIFEAAQIRPVLIVSPSDLEQSAEAFAKDNGYAYFKPTIEISDTVTNSAAITSKLEDFSGYISILIPLTEKTEDLIPNLLKFISIEKITVMPLLETMT